MSKLYLNYCQMIRRVKKKLCLREKCPLATQLMAETFGTFTLIFYGLAANCQRNLTGNVDISQQFLCNSLASGIGVTIAFLMAGRASPAIFNPAFVFSNAFTGRLRFFHIPFYLFFEVVGAFLGALAVLAVYYTKIWAYAEEHDGGQLLVGTTGGIFVTLGTVQLIHCVLDQIITTAFLAMVIYAITDSENINFPPNLFAMAIGLTVYVVVGTYASNASAALNPARDLGPRIMIAICGWGEEAFKQNNYYFWVPCLMPIVGGVLGGFVYEGLIGIHLVPRTRKEVEDLKILSE